MFITGTSCRATGEMAASQTPGDDLLNGRLISAQGLLQALLAHSDSISLFGSFLVRVDVFLED